MCIRDSNSINQNIRPAFSWTPLANASRYDIQITRSSSFSEVIFNIENIAVTSLTFSGYLDGGTEYFWRVRGENDCFTGNWSSPFTFTTESCYYYPAADLPIPIPSSGAQTINSVSYTHLDVYKRQVVKVINDAFGLAKKYKSNY